MNEVQAPIDGLAERIGRPVGVDDRRFRAIAYSSHASDVDTVRRASIMGRQAPLPVTEWLEALGVERAIGYLRVPANEEFGMVPRVCFPLRFHDRLLGFLWLVEDRAPLDGDELSSSSAVAAELAEELFRLRQQQSDEFVREARTVDDLVLVDRDVRAVDSGRADGSLAKASVYGVIVIELDVTDDGALGPGPGVRLTEAIARVRRAASPRHVLASVRDAGAVVLVAVDADEEVHGRAFALSVAAEAELADTDGVRVVVASGTPVHRISDLPGSFRQAKAVAGVALAAEEVGSPAFAEELGAYRLIARMLESRDPNGYLPPPLLRILDDPDAVVLVTTLEAYLERAGDTSAAAGDLFLHRSSLYHRLRRIEEVAGVDMHSGADRLELHLGLRLWRLAGGTTAVAGAAPISRR